EEGAARAECHGLPIRFFMTPNFSFSAPNVQSPGAARRRVGAPAHYPEIANLMATRTYLAAAAFWRSPGDARRARSRNRCRRKDDAGDESAGILAMTRLCLSRATAPGAIGVVSIFRRHFEYDHTEIM
ncbi:hypothetical protein, partial [Mycobacterium sp. 852002-50816_SCH5313054-b]|uniref:hypothetical protein n=1 Tax=Mycobacterium sp. 852002-50816_SCH5313054-b TaxID=1834092 RepID=UPI001E4EA22A